MSKELIFLVEEAPEGGYLAQALGHSIYTEADTWQELREAVQDAVQCHFDDMDTLSDKVAIMSGASRGIDEASATACVQTGSTVVLTQTKELDLAIQAYMDRKTDLRGGAFMAGVSYNRFMREVQFRNIVILENDDFVDQLTFLAETFDSRELRVAVNQVRAMESQS